jgi:hypothetical protein
LLALKCENVGLKGETALPKGLSVACKILLSVQGKRQGVELVWQLKVLVKTNNERQLKQKSVS